MAPSGFSPEIGAADADNGPLVPCPDCGRRFNPDSIGKHIKICKKVFQQKRKQFNSVEARLGDLDGAKELIEKASRPDPPEKSKPKDKDKVPKWEKQSLAFRQAILAAKAATGDVEAMAKAEEIKLRLDKAGDLDSDLTKCPHCGRTFNKEAGERHIAICLRTFGSKPGGGRLVKGSGQNAMKPTTGAPSPTPAAMAPPPEFNFGGRGPSTGGGASARAPSAGPPSGPGGSAARKPSAPPGSQRGRPSVGQAPVANGRPQR